MPLVLCSIVALALVIERFLSLRESRVAPPRLVDEVMSVTRTALPPADTLNKLAENSILGLVLAQGLRAASAEPRITEPNLRAAFESAGLDRSDLHRIDLLVVNENLPVQVVPAGEAGPSNISDDLALRHPLALGDAGGELVLAVEHLLEGDDLAGVRGHAAH